MDPYVALMTLASITEVVVTKLALPILAWLVEQVRPGVTEASIAERLLAEYRSLGAEGHSFSPIVSFGANAADPHHFPDETTLRPGDPVLFDVGCRQDSYCSDMNKGLEVIEAFHLYGVPVERIKVLVHPQSVVHSLVEFHDGSQLAQLGTPDMIRTVRHSLSLLLSLAALALIPTAPTTVNAADSTARMRSSPVRLRNRPSRMAVSLAPATRATSSSEGRGRGIMPIL